MNDKYLPYQLEDYLQDEVFISGVKNNMQSPAHLDAWLKQNFQNENIAREAATIITRLNFKVESPGSSQKQKMWHVIDQKTSQNQGRIVSGKKLLITLGGIAASILFILYFFGDSIFSTQMLTTSRGEQLSISMPDDSQIELNAESIISYDKKEFKKARKLNLNGEAFFNVKKGNDFVVNTPNGSIKVLGTSFNVFSRKNLFEVKCFSGKVLVIANMDSIILDPGHAVSFENGNNLQRDLVFSPEEIKIWKEGHFHYENEKLDFVLEELERQFNIYIDMDPSIDPDSLQYTGYFTNRNVEKALKDVLWPLHFEFEINGKKVQISTSK